MNTRNVVPVPGLNEGKKEQVAGMFDRIAYKYDFLNHLFSMGIDKGWRRKAIRSIHDIHPSLILDVATGTGDFAMAAMAIHPEKVTGIDISEGMLEVGRKKMAEAGLEDRIHLEYGDSETMRYEDNSFDAITCGYGVRNFENLEKGLTQMHRVLKPGGKVAILEFSRPKTFPVKQLYYFYFRYIMPKMGKMVSKDATAYTYLPESVMVFPEGKEFTAIMEKCGFRNAKAQPLTFGITTLYTATK